MSTHCLKTLDYYVNKHVYGAVDFPPTYTELQCLGLELMAFGRVKHHQCCVSDPENTRFTPEYIEKIRCTLLEQQNEPRLEMRPREGSVTVFEIKGGRVRRQHCIVHNGYVVSSCKVHDVTSSCCDGERCESCPDSLRFFMSTRSVPSSVASVSSPLQMPSASPDDYMHDVCGMLLDESSRDSFHTANGGIGTTTALHGSLLVV